MKTVLLFIILGFTSSSALSIEGEWGEINEWAGVGFAQAYIVYPDKNQKSFQSVIADDPDGKQVIEFRFMDSSLDRCSSPFLSGLNDVVISVAGKRVKMKAGCKRVAITSVLRYFATTAEGRKHIVDAFKQESYVKVKMQGYDVNIPARGFTQAWDKYGGDAI